MKIQFDKIDDDPRVRTALALLIRAAREDEGDAKADTHDALGVVYKEIELWLECQVKNATTA